MVIRCAVELFGVPREITELREIKVKLKEPATLEDVVAALKREVPMFEGRVTRAGENRLAEHFAFNVNGQLYFDDDELELRDGDCVMLLTLATGG